MFVLIELIYDIIKRGEGEGTPAIKAEPISAAGEGGEGIIYGIISMVVLSLYFMFCVLAVLKHASARV